MRERKREMGRRSDRVRESESGKERGRDTYQFKD